MGTDHDRFSVDDLKAISQLAIATWQSGLDRDWSVPAGTLEWSCRTTAEHAVGHDLIDGLRATTNILWAVIVTAEPDVRAVIRRRPAIETAPPQDFAPRGVLELILHTHDISMGLGIPFDPPRDLCGRLFAHTRHWPQDAIERTDDPWSDLLASRGRPRPG